MYGLVQRIEENLARDNSYLDSMSRITEDLCKEGRKPEREVEKSCKFCNNWNESSAGDWEDKQQWKLGCKNHLM